VSPVEPVEGADVAHRGPDAPPWRRAWALDAPPSRERDSGHDRGHGRGRSWPQ
jgi:hypothetical protein